MQGVDGLARNSSSCFTRTTKSSPRQYPAKLLLRLGRIAAWRCSTHMMMALRSRTIVSLRRLCLPKETGRFRIHKALYKALLALLILNVEAKENFPGPGEEIVSRTSILFKLRCQVVRTILQGWLFMTSHDGKLSRHLREDAQSGIRVACCPQAGTNSASGAWRTSHKLLGSEHLLALPRQSKCFCMRCGHHQYQYQHEPHAVCIRRAMTGG